MLHFFFLLLAFHGFQRDKAQGDGLGRRLLKRGDQPASALELDVYFLAEGLFELGEHLERPVQPGGRDRQGVVFDVLVEGLMDGLVHGGAVVPVDGSFRFFNDDFHVVFGTEDHFHQETAPCCSGLPGHADNLFFVHIPINKR